MLVISNVLLQLPLFLEMIEISSEFWTTGISLLECEVLPDFYVKVRLWRIDLEVLD